MVRISKLTIDETQLEDREAYATHIKSAHFLKYKTGTRDMVKSLELVEAVPLVAEMKIK
jgi:quinol monooxygenase YgiN